jgi:virginiamycin B lyase
LTGRRLIGWAAVGGAALLLAVGAAGTAIGAPLGSITEVPLGLRAHSYLFGLTGGPDGAVWFADLSCTGLGRCAIGRVDRRGRLSEYRRGLAAGSVPYTIAAGADGNLWFTDEGRRPAVGRITPRGQITEFHRGLAGGSEPFTITAGPAGDMWFTDQGK